MLVMQPITGENAEAIAKECPGLFEVEGKGQSRKATVKPAREHTQLLEKVLTCDFNAVKFTGSNRTEHGAVLRPLCCVTSYRH